jgi:hypothetical protein
MTKKVIRFESRRGQNEKKSVFQFEKHNFFIALFWVVLGLCISNMNCKA